MKVHHLQKIHPVTSFHLRAGQWDARRQIQVESRHGYVLSGQIMNRMACSARTHFRPILGVARLATAKTPCNAPVPRRSLFVSRPLRDLQPPNGYRPWQHLPLLKDNTTSEYSWIIPERFNVGAACLDVHCELPQSASRTAIIQLSDGSHSQSESGVEYLKRTFSFGDLRSLSDAFCTMLLEAQWAQDTDLAVKGSASAVLLPQTYLTPVAHLSFLRLGVITVPLSPLFGPEALATRLSAARCRTLVTNSEGLERVRQAAQEGGLEELRVVFVIRGGDKDPLLDPAAEGRPAASSLKLVSPLLEVLSRPEDTFKVVDLHDELAAHAGTQFTPRETRSDDPAIVIFTSGTTGPPKGALHAHRVLLGHLPGVAFPQEGMPKPGDVFWTPADWSWIGGLLDVLLPALHWGVPVVARDRGGRFDPEEALRVVQYAGVTNGFVPPTALKMLRAHFPLSSPDGGAEPLVHMRSIGSGGEQVGREVVQWSKGVLGCGVNEFYGQTECNLVLGNGGGLPPVLPGWTGTPIPGHVVDVVRLVDDRNESNTGEEQVGQRCVVCAEEEEGQIAVRYPDPVMFLGYLDNPKATENKFATCSSGHKWLLTGDLGVKGSGNAQGYFRFVSRDDDVITYAGYRIGPSEIETALHHHPDVHLSAVVGVADPLKMRTEIIKACVVLGQGTPDSDINANKAKEIARWVGERVAAFEKPKVVEFRRNLPTTTTGKILRRTLKNSGSHQVAEMARLGRTTMSGEEIGDADVIFVWAEDGAVKGA
ncbi:acetyl-CoA synthetase-like protein, partial [Gonapodya prolifera JEL478]